MFVCSTELLKGVLKFYRNQYTDNHQNHKQIFAPASNMEDNVLQIINIEILQQTIIVQ